MSRQRLEDQAISFLLEVDQEQEINEILSNDQRKINGTQVINQMNINSKISSAQNEIGGWNGESQIKGNLIKRNNHQKLNRNMLSRNLRAISAQNENSPRGYQQLTNKITKQQITEQIDFLGNLARKNSWQISEVKRNTNSRLQRSYDGDQEKDKIIINIDGTILNGQQNDEFNQAVDGQRKGNLINSDEEDVDETFQLIGRKRQVRVVNKVKQKTNLLSLPKQLDQAKLNLFDQVNSKTNSVFTPLNISKQQYSPTQNQVYQGANSPQRVVDINNQFKVKIDVIQEKIQQYIDLNDKTMDALKKITEVRRNSLLLQKNNLKQLPIQTHDFIPIELLNHQNLEQCKQKDQIDQAKLKQLNDQFRQQEKIEIFKQRENYRNYLEQPSTMPQIVSSNSKPMLTPRNSSSINKNQYLQNHINSELQQSSVQSTPIKPRNYRLTPTETKRLIDHIENQGRNYLSSSPTKTKNNGIKFRISKKQSVIDPPTIQITPNHLNNQYNNNNFNQATILDSINFDDENSNSSNNNMKQIILQKISQQNSPNQIIDLSTKSSNAYKSLKKQRIINSSNGQYNTNIGSLFQNSTYRGTLIGGNSNCSQQLDFSKNNGSVQMENSLLLPTSTPFESSFNNIKSQNQCKVEDFFIQKQEIHTAPLKNRPRMNLKKLNIVKQMNFELENTLCKQTPISNMLQNGQSNEYNHQVSLNLPSQVRMNKITQGDLQQQQLNEYQKIVQKLTPNYRHNSLERKRMKVVTINQQQDNQVNDFYCHSTPHPEQLQKEKIFARSKENQQIHLNQLQQNSSRINEKSIQLHPKNLF